MTLSIFFPPFFRQAFERARRPVLAGVCAFLAAIAPLLPARADTAANDCAKSEWPLWDTFKKSFIQSDGRVVDANVATMHTTSEGQSYAMFFALVANDPAIFDRVWKWTETNLFVADGDGLPAWQWGQSKTHAWEILDSNSAADSDLWLAFDLLEAGRVWQRRDYVFRARALLGYIAANEVVQLPGLGKMLLPGAHGFMLNEHTWRLNPSYMPLPVLRQLAMADRGGPWLEIASNTAKVIEKTSPLGYVPDWVVYQATGPKTGKFLPDTVKPDLGSYDAIRAYMWAGMTDPSDPAGKSIMRSLGGMERHLAKFDFPPETVNTVSGTVDGEGSSGFSAAVLPYLLRLARKDLLGPQHDRAMTRLTAATEQAAREKRQPPYYDYVLNLFGQGWLEGKFTFKASGTTQFSWELPCRRAFTH